MQDLSIRWAGFACLLGGLLFLAINLLPLPSPSILVDMLGFWG